jgi:hypothetical protein
MSATITGTASGVVAVREGPSREAGGVADAYVHIHVEGVIKGGKAAVGAVKQVGWVMFGLSSVVDVVVEQQRLAQVLQMHYNGVVGYKLSGVVNPVQLEQLLQTRVLVLQSGCLVDQEGDVLNDLVQYGCLVGLHASKHVNLDKTDIC